MTWLRYWYIFLELGLVDIMLMWGLESESCSYTAHMNHVEGGHQDDPEILENYLLFFQSNLHTATGSIGSERSQWNRIQPGAHRSGNNQSSSWIMGRAICTRVTVRRILKHVQVRYCLYHCTRIRSTMSNTTVMVLIYQYELSYASLWQCIVWHVQATSRQLPCDVGCNCLL